MVLSVFLLKQKLIILLCMSVCVVSKIWIVACRFLQNAMRTAEKTSSRRRQACLNPSVQLYKIQNIRASYTTLIVGYSSQITGFFLQNTLNCRENIKSKTSTLSVESYKHLTINQKTLLIYIFPKCHREKRLGHTGKLKQRFSKRQVGSFTICKLGCQTCP